jgi:hypothetical protein
MSGETIWSKRIAARCFSWHTVRPTVLAEGVGGASIVSSAAGHELGPGAEAVKFTLCSGIADTRSLQA